MKKLLIAFLLLTSLVFADDGDINLIAKIAPKNNAFDAIVDAANVGVDTTNFSSNLSSSDSILQHALDTIDDLVLGGAETDPYSLHLNGDNIPSANFTGWTTNLETTGTLGVGNLTIGSGEAGVDYTLTFNGENNDGVLTWMEDENYFKFNKDIFITKSRPHYALSDTGTGYCSADMYTNATQNFLRFGIEQAAGGGFVSGSEPYESLLFSNGEYPLSLWTNSVRRVKVEGDGDVVIGNATTNWTTGIVDLTGSGWGYIPSLTANGSVIPHFGMIAATNIAQVGFAGDYSTAYSLGGGSIGADACSLEYTYSTDTLWIDSALQVYDTDDLTRPLNFTIGEHDITTNPYLRLYGYLTSTNSAKYSQLELDDTDDYIHWTREDANILGIKVDMPVLGANASRFGSATEYVELGYEPIDISLVEPGGGVINVPTITPSDIGIDSTLLTINGALATLSGEESQGIIFLHLTEGVLDNVISISPDFDAETLYVSSNIAAYNDKDITASQFTSYISSGTAPLVVNSNTLVSNLNADLLDGNEASAFSLTSHNHSATYQPLDDDLNSVAGLNTAGLIKRTDSTNYTTITDSSANWDSAYGWGDHSTVGYLTSATGFILDQETPQDVTLDITSFKFEELSGLLGGALEIVSPMLVGTGTLNEIPFSLISVANRFGIYDRDDVGTADIAFISNDFSQFYTFFVDFNDETIYSSTHLAPDGDGSYDLGQVSNRWQNLYLSGTATLTAITIGANTLNTDEFAVLDGITSASLYTDEKVDDRVASLIQNGTGITWSYNDGDGTLTPTVTITQYTDELAQDSIGNNLGTGLAYNDTTGAISLSFLGIQSLTDPNADTLMGWDDTDGATKFIAIGSNLSYDHATHTLSASGGGGGVTDGDKGDIVVSSSGSVWTIDPTDITAFLLIDQTTPQTVTNGMPYFSGGLRGWIYDNQTIPKAAVWFGNAGDAEGCLLDADGSTIMIDWRGGMLRDKSGDESIDWLSRALIAANDGNNFTFMWNPVPRFPKFTSDGFLKTSSSNGTLAVDTNTYLTSVTAHNILSATHGDTLTGSVVRGDIMIGNSTPKWARKAKGSAGQLITFDANDVIYTTATYPATTTANQILLSTATNTVGGDAGLTYDPSTDILTVNGAVKAADGADTYSIFGRSAIGYAGYSNYASFSHKDMASAGNYAVLQDSTGSTHINSATGKFTAFKINNTAIMTMDVNGLNVASGKVIELGHASDTTLSRLAAGWAGVESKYIPAIADPNADRIYFWDDSAGTPAFLTAGTGLTISGTTMNVNAVGTSDHIMFNPKDAKVGHLASPAQIDGSQSRWYLLFDASSAEYADFEFAMPSTYSTANTITITIYYKMASATSGNVVWAASLMANAEGEPSETDSFDTANSTTDAVQGTVTNMGVCSITMTNKDSINPLELGILKIYRDGANASDTATGDAQLAYMIMEWS